MSKPIRNSVKVILLNEKNELLLISADDPKTTSVEGKYHGKFWFLVGGEIESDESIEKAAIREILEETGIKEVEIDLGPVVWFGEFDLVLDGILTHLKQTFIVAKTKQNRVSFANLNTWENRSFQALKWFSIDQIKNSKEIIYPVGLSEYLKDIISGKYPQNPIYIDLAKKPN